MAWRRVSLKRKRLLMVSACTLAVLLGAGQWRLYDATHGRAERFTYYVVTCTYLFGVLAPAVLWLDRRWRFELRTWRQALPIHITASISLTGVGVFFEAAIAWLPHTGQWPFEEALRHYFTQHTQISILTYWALLGALQIYRVHDRTRLRELHAAQLETQLREAQLMALRSQLQPHFLFNTLQAATMLIYEDPHGAEEVLLSLSELLRLSLQTFQQQEIPLRTEIEFLKHYAAIQQRRFGNRLRFDFEVDQQCEVCAIPALITQPLLENAVRYGVGVHREADIVSIHAVKDPNRLKIEIKNQSSVLGSPMEALLSRGVGLSNTMARLERLYGNDYSFEVRDLMPKGVLVLLSIPVRFLHIQAEEPEFQAAS